MTARTDACASRLDRCGWVAAAILVCGTCLSPLSGQQVDRAVLDQQAAAAERAKDWPSALKAAEALNDDAEQRHVDSLYRVARLQALSGNYDRALEYLERVREAGLFDVQRLRADAAFTPMRDMARFRAVSQAIWLKGYLWILERPERDAYQQPERVVDALAFRAGERVADIGAGSGYFTRRISRRVGPAGVVWALDIRPEILAIVEQRAREEGLANIRTRTVTPTDPQLPPGGVDTVLMVDTLHYVKDRAAYAKTLRAGMAPGGRVVVVDFIPKSPEERPWGPPPEQKMSRAEVDAAMAEAGLFPARVHEFLTEQFFVEYRAR